MTTQRRIARGIAAVLIGLTGAGVAQAQPETASKLLGDHAARFEHYAVAADHERASRAGAEILAAGGNAVDAAVATSFALSVVRPFSCGIGGGGFMVINLRTHPTRTIPPGGLRAVYNYRETTPEAIGPKFFENRPAGASVQGGLAVGVPGTVAGLLAALNDLGTLDRATVLAPAIRLAREGFATDAAYVAAANETIADFGKHPEWRARFGPTWDRMLGGGKIAVGTVIKNPEQANALELIAKDGATAMYDGPIGAAVVEAVRADGGVMTTADLKAFKAEVREPLVYSFEGRTFLGMPPPSSGGVAMAETLGVLERVGISRVARERGGLNAPYLSLLTEAFKHAFADRSRWLADAESGEAAVRRLLNPDYLETLAKRTTIGKTHTPAYYGSGWKLDDEGHVIPDDAGTSHLCVIDGAGNAVACTETINLSFGSLLPVAKYGFVLNNQMDDFTTRAGQVNAFGLRQSEENRPAPGRRPLSSMSPTIVLDADGSVRAVVGASGGPRIITGTTMVVLNALVLGMPAGEAVAAPRLHHQWQPNRLQVDARLREPRWEGLAALDWLKKLGHQPVPLTSESAVQLILRGEGGWEAASDPRKGGRTAGG